MCLSQKHLINWEELKQKIQLLQQVEIDKPLILSIVNLYNDRNIEWVQYVRKMGFPSMHFHFGLMDAGQSVME